MPDSKLMQEFKRAVDTSGVTMMALIIAARAAGLPEATIENLKTALANLTAVAERHNG